MTLPKYEKMKFMFQTTNQICNAKCTGIMKTKTSLETGAAWISIGLVLAAGLERQKCHVHHGYMINEDQ
jgi:hypothetical protein